MVTDRAVIEVTEEGAFLASVHWGEEPDRVLADTPMPLRVRSGGPALTEPPTYQQLEIIRTQLDPQGWYTR